MAVSASLPPDLRCRAGIEALAPCPPDTGRGFLFFVPLRPLVAKANIRVTGAMTPYGR